jgi:hypothetical protein
MKWFTVSGTVSHPTVAHGSARKPSAQSATPMLMSDAPAIPPMPLPTTGRRASGAAGAVAEGVRSRSSAMTANPMAASARIARSSPQPGARPVSTGPTARRRERSTSSAATPAVVKSDASSAQAA